MPYNGVRLAGYVRRVLGGHEGVDLNRLLETPSSIQDFENSLVFYAPYLGISLELFSHIKKSRFRQIFSAEQFFKEGACSIPKNFQWDNFHKKELRTLLEKFIKIFVEKVLKDARTEVADLRRTCGILYNPLRPDLLEKTIARHESSPYLMLSQPLSRTVTFSQSRSFGSHVLAQTQLQRTVVMDQSSLDLVSRDVESSASTVVQIPSQASQVLVAIKSIRKKYLNQIIELKKQVEQARDALNYVEQQRSGEVEALKEKLIQVQVELRFKSKALEALTQERVSNERLIYQLVYKIGQYETFLFKEYEAYTGKNAEIQKLKEEHDSLILERQKNLQRIQQLEALLSSSRQTINQIQINIGTIAPVYFQIKAEKSAIEDTLLRAMSDIEVLRREYKEKFISFEAQLKELQAKKIDMAASHSSVDELQKIILEKEKQLQVVEEKLSQIESSYRSQIEELQEKLRNAEEIHKLNLLKAQQEYQKSLAQREGEQAKLKEIHSLSVKVALQELEESYRSQIAALQEQGLEKDKALSSATDNQMSLQLKIRQLEVQFEYEKSQLKETLEKQFQEKLSAFMGSSQEQIAQHKSLYEEQHQTLLRIQQEKDELQCGFVELQGKLDIEKEKLRQKEETLQLVQSQNSSLEAERQVHVVDHQKKLKELREIFEQQNATLQRDLDLQHTDHLEKLRAKEEELMAIKVALQQVKASKESLEVQLEKIRLEKAAKEKTETAVCSDGLASVSADVQSKTEREVSDEPGVEQSLERENQMLRLRIKELEAQNRENLERVKTEAETRVKGYKERFDEMDSLNGEIYSDYEALKEDYDVLEKSHATLSEKYKKLSEEVERYKGLISEGNKENIRQGQLVQYASHGSQAHQTSSVVIRRSPLQVRNLENRF